MLTFWHHTEYDILVVQQTLVSPILSAMFDVVEQYGVRIRKQLRSYHWQSFSYFGDLSPAKTSNVSET